MTGEFHTPNLPPDSDRRSGPRVKPDWSGPSGAKTPAPAPYDSHNRKNMDERPAPPEAFVRSLSTFLGCEMTPVQVKRGEIWRWNLHPGAGVLTQPWPPGRSGAGAFATKVTRSGITSLSARGRSRPAP
jgi:hypothetical protein